MGCCRLQDIFWQVPMQRRIHGARCRPSGAGSQPAFAPAPHGSRAALDCAAALGSRCLYCAQSRPQSLWARGSGPPVHRCGTALPTQGAYTPCWSSPSREFSKCVPPCVPSARTAERCTSVLNPPPRIAISRGFRESMSLGMPVWPFKRRDPLYFGEADTLFRLKPAGCFGEAEQLFLAQATRLLGLLVRCLP